MKTAAPRRGFTLVEIVAMLPILAVVVALSYATINEVEHMRDGETMARQDLAMISDVARRCQEDAALATEATASQSETSSELVLRGPGGAVTYKWDAGEGISRLETGADDQVKHYTWKPRRVQVAFSIESIGGQPRLVWMVASFSGRESRGPDYTRTLSVAAPLAAGDRP